MFIKGVIYLLMLGGIFSFISPIMPIIDIIYLMTAWMVLFFVLFMRSAPKKGAYSPTAVLMSLVLLAEIITYNIYGQQTSAPAMHKDAATISMLALVALMSIRGGGVVKLLVMMLYGIIIVNHYLFATFYSDLRYPYLDIVVLLSYIQLMAVLFSPKIESTSWYDYCSRLLVNRPILGKYFSYYIGSHFDGSDTIYQKEKK